MHGTPFPYSVNWMVDDSPPTAERPSQIANEAWKGQAGPPSSSPTDALSPAPTMVTIPLSQGLVAIVDAGDYERVVAYPWYAVRQRRTVYAACRNPTRWPKELKMHRLIMGAPPDLEVDHINRNGLDNRRANLRLCTHAENMRNRPANKARPIPYKGVSQHKRKSRYEMEVSGGHKVGERHRRCLSIVRFWSFTSPEAAACAYDALVRIIWGEFAYENFPLERTLQKVVP